MKNIKKHILAVCLLPAFISTPSFADNIPATDWYTSISGDVTWLDESGADSTAGGGGNIALGSRFAPSSLGDFRIEAELGYHDISSSHYWTYMGNLYYDFNLSNSSSLKIMPYVGAGLGDATIHLSEDDAFGRYNDSGNVFAYQFMAGLNFVTDSAPNTEWYIGYRYLGSDSLDTSDNAGFGTSDKLEANNIELGVRFHF